MINRDIGEDESERAVWRYMPFAKFASLLTYRALWFSRLEHLDDPKEGKIPASARVRMDEEDRRFAQRFQHLEHRRQVEGWNAENEAGGRAYSVVNCWFLGEAESAQMWKDYAPGSEGVAVRSTLGRLARSVPDDNILSLTLGRVRYVEHNTHEMDSYEACLPVERALLKDRESFAHEQEVRLIALNLRTINCVGPDGRLYEPHQVAGAKMNNADPDGLYIGVATETLIEEIVVSPTAQEWFENLVRRLTELCRVSARVSRSKLSPP